MSSARAFQPKSMQRDEAIGLRKSFEQLGVVFTKVGQMLSTRSDVIPDVLCRELQLLHSRVESFPANVAIAEIEKAIGKSIDSQFTSFYLEPLGAGSVAQCHAAVLNAEAVVVKVRRPGIVAQVQSDLRIFSYLSERFESVFSDLKALGLIQFCKELHRALERELDFRYEARNLKHFSKSLGPEVLVPKPIMHLCTETTVVMSYIVACPITKFARCTTTDNIRVILNTLLRCIAQMLVLDESGLFHADLHPGNVLVTPEGNLVILDFGLMGVITPDQRQQINKILMGLIAGSSRTVAIEMLQMCSCRTNPSQQPPEGLIHVCETIVDEFLNKQLKSPAFSEQTEVFFRACRKFDYSLPTQFALLFKAVCTVEGIGRSLLPEFDVIAAVRPVLIETMVSQFAPSRVASRMLHLMTHDSSPFTDILKHAVVEMSQGLSVSFIGQRILAGVENLRTQPAAHKHSSVSGSTPTTVTDIINSRNDEYDADEYETNHMFYSDETNLRRDLIDQPRSRLSRALRTMRRMFFFATCCGAIAYFLQVI